MLVVKNVMMEETIITVMVITTTIMLMIMVIGILNHGVIIGIGNHMEILAYIVIIILKAEPITNMDIPIIMMVVIIMNLEVIGMNTGETIIIITITGGTVVVPGMYMK